MTAAQQRFEAATVEFFQGGSRAKWRLVKRTLKRLEAEARRSLAFLDELGDDERAILGMFLAERARPYLDHWRNFVDALDAGCELKISPDDIPVWFDGD